MCRGFFCVVGRGCLLWPVSSLGKTLLALALLHFVLWGQICLLLQVSLDFNILANLGNSAGLEEVNFHSNPKEGQCQKCSNYYTVALISHSSKVMFKILQARLQQYVNHELPDVQPGFRKGRGIRDQIADIFGIIEKEREFQKKNLLLLYWLHQSLWLYRSPQTVENSSRDGNTRPADLPPEKHVCRSRSKS